MSKKIKKLIKQKSFWLITLLLGFLLGILSTYIIINKTELQDFDALQGRLESMAAQKYIKDIQAQNRVNVVVGDDPVKGDENASVEIVVFDDFECPFCAKFFQETYSQIMEKYGEEIRYVFKDFPLSFHEHAWLAHRAANCAGQQGKFWDMHDRLFVGDISSEEALRAHASAIGLDMASFSTCLASKDLDAEMQDDIEYGKSLGINGTPGFFINGLKVEGALPYEIFEEIVKAEM